MRYVTKSIVYNAATGTLVNPSGTNGADASIKKDNGRRYRVHKVATVSGTNIKITEVQTGNVLWFGQVTETTFNEEPLRSMTGGQDLQFDAAGATNISVQYSLEGA